MYIFSLSVSKLRSQFLNNNVYMGSSIYYQYYQSIIINVIIIPYACVHET